MLDDPESLSSQAANSMCDVNSSVQSMAEHAAYRQTREVDQQLADSHMHYELLASLQHLCSIALVAGILEAGCRCGGAQRHTNTAPRIASMQCMSGSALTLFCPCAPCRCYHSINTVPPAHTTTDH